MNKKINPLTDKKILKKNLLRCLKNNGKKLVIISDITFMGRKEKHTQFSNDIYSVKVNGRNYEFETISGRNEIYSFDGGVTPAGRDLHAYFVTHPTSSLSEGHGYLL